MFNPSDYGFRLPQQNDDRCPECQCDGGHFKFCSLLPQLETEELQIDVFFLRSLRITPYDTQVIRTHLKKDVQC
jgi:hypothetical protein